MHAMQASLRQHSGIAASSRWQCRPRFAFAVSLQRFNLRHTSLVSASQLHRSVFTLAIQQWHRCNFTLAIQASYAYLCGKEPAGATMSHAEASRVLQHALKAAFPLADSSRWSMHSLRIGAATALMTARASMELIQALCRWRSPKKSQHLRTTWRPRLRHMARKGASRAC
jgi:hypothetical protein